MIAGSSGGHILPAIKYINNLSVIKEPKEILFISNEIGNYYLNTIKNENINKIILNSKNKFIFILKISFKLFKVLIFNRRITLLGFGGFITTPILLIAKLFNIFLLSFNKIFIHEQNIIYGLANKINYLIATNAFITFPKVNLRRKEILVGNFFSDENKMREKLNDNLLNILLIGGSAGSIDLNNKMCDEIKILDKNDLEKIKLFIQVPEIHLEIYKERYTKLIDSNRCVFFSFKNNLNFKEFDLILSRSGSGSLNEILYYTNNVYFTPHLISRDQHQKYNLNYFLSHNMSLKKFLIPDKKNLMSQFYFNSLINPHSINKMICYTTR